MEHFLQSLLGQAQVICRSVVPAFIVIIYLIADVFFYSFQLLKKALCFLYPEYSVCLGLLPQYLSSSLLTGVDRIITNTPYSCQTFLQY